MIKRPGRFRRSLFLLANAGGAVRDLAHGLATGDEGRRWMMPLAVFLCLTGLLLVLGASVEALAPFIYSIF